MREKVLLVLFIHSFLISCTQPSDPNVSFDVPVEPSEMTNIVNSEEDQLKYNSYESEVGQKIQVSYFDKNDKKYVKIRRKDSKDLILERSAFGMQGEVYEFENYRWIKNTHENIFSDGEEIVKYVESN